jgi:vacuolar-type H+-ATPase subunit E/Vma4
MEELQSTEILDREILEDARKKAYRILKTADETVKANAEAWEKKTESALNELREKYARRRDSAVQEIMARLPMDKRRARSEKVESLLRSAADSWYQGLDRKSALGILKNELKQRLDQCPEFSSHAPRALIHNLEIAEARALFQELLPEQNIEIEKIVREDPYPGITLENSAVRITASITMTMDFLLHEKRAELSTALVGEADLID